ncbi:hypothetical protein JAAARDRAFT_195404 [Jaapia argillacea MUCL 33604]|uniref:Prolyl 4-hydroxylase alpha subunit Fe(2+) 2OG dioxygenase domain-containing protein n=1 Tax=Jaapia argillacea MUCL 33604 TaxID=933084 RepID=A0A067PL74_9AGAM|nr:hypothetical protein JAAARDRAFT_195404 [Jaapia argillacea MUCL 33604]
MSANTKSPSSKPLSGAGRVDGPPLPGVSGFRTVLDLQEALRHTTVWPNDTCTTTIRALRHIAEDYGGSKADYDSDEESKPEPLIKHNLLEVHRVEPYKIHLYAPGGHFRPHRDTPSTNLVGTFLLGLGDSTHSRYLNVDGMKLSAEGGTWYTFSSTP